MSRNRISDVVAAVAIALALAPPAARAASSLRLASEPGDPVGGGQTLTLTEPASPFASFSFFGYGASIAVGPPSGDRWLLDFQAPFDGPLVTGDYPNAVVAGSSHGASPGLSAAFGAAACPTLTGRFRIKQISVNDDFTLGAFWAVFEQRCEGASGALRGEIRINVSAPVILDAPLAVRGTAGTPIVFDVVANAAAPVTITATGLPAGASLTHAGGNRATFAWTPAVGQTGDLRVTFAAGGDDCETAIHVAPAANAAPVAEAGGPYAAIAAEEVAFDGSASRDPEGAPLTYLWDFGDGATGEGVAPRHAYAAPGAYTVTLTVSDGELSSSDAAEVVVEAPPPAPSRVLPARAFTAPGQHVVRLRSQRPAWCVQIEPVGAAWSLGDVVHGSVTLGRAGAPETDAIAAAECGPDRDRDANGVRELRAAFDMDALRGLLAGASGRAVVPVTVRGALAGGGRFEAALALDARGPKPPAVRLVPGGGANPALAAGEPALEVATDGDGFLRVEVFDVGGRLVRTLFDQPFVPATALLLRLSDRGEPLQTGVYFVRAASPGGETRDKIVVVR